VFKAEDLHCLVKGFQRFGVVPRLVQGFAFVAQGLGLGIALLRQRSIDPCNIGWTVVGECRGRKPEYDSGRNNKSFHPEISQFGGVL
jgi:hypothetical protein